jgi:hypothetical protein
VTVELLPPEDVETYLEKKESLASGLSRIAVPAKEAFVGKENAQIAEVDSLEAFTNAELRAMLDAKGIGHRPQDSKSVLIAKLSA